MGWQQGVVTQLQAGNTIINANGIFTYTTASPQPGTLIISQNNTGANFTDPAGNVAPPGVCVYANEGSFFQAAQYNAGFLQFLTAPTEAGPWTSAVQLNLTSSGSAATGWNLIDQVNGAILRGATSGGQLQIQILSNVASVPLLTGPDPSNLLIPETWHAITLDAGWSTVAGYSIPQYRRTPDGALQLSGNADAGSLQSANKTLNNSHPLGSGWQPSGTRVFRSFSGPGQRGAVQIDTNGVITMLANASFQAQFCELDAVVKLIQ